MTTPFVAGERQRAARWKASCAHLPDECRAAADYVSGGGRTIDGPFDFCLAPHLAAWNLLPDARDTALTLFTQLGIPWHAGVGAGPSNHLLDSQVQCVNALAPMVRDPDGVRRAFGEVLPIADVLPIEDDRVLTFEWIGQVDHLGEGGGMARTRGARTTSSDAAIRYRAHDGAVEVALIEWKYTEDYTGKELSGGPDALETRLARYRPLWDSELCPIRPGAIGYGELFREPLYQLFRQQLLAACMEATHELDAERVRVVVAAPSTNRALAADLRRWPKLLRRPDRWARLDTITFLDARSPMSDYYRARYG